MRLFPARSLLFAAWIAGGVCAAALDVEAEPALDLSRPVKISCETSAVKLDTNPFGASQGTVVIEVKVDDVANLKGPGRWKVIQIPAEHDFSDIGKTRETCQPDCPMTQGKDGMLQLWSPKPLALSQLDDDTALTLVTIDADSLELKASTFQKKELAGLERGDCKLVEPTAAKEAAPEKEPEGIAPTAPGDETKP